MRHWTVRQCVRSCEGIATARQRLELAACLCVHADRSCFPHAGDFRRIPISP